MVMGEMLMMQFYVACDGTQEMSNFGIGIS
jgi:hypothetical protein